GSQANRARPGTGVCLGLPASAEARGSGQEGQGRLRRRHARLHHAGKAGSRDEPPARLLHPAAGHPDAVPEGVRPHFSLRMEGPRPLLRHRYERRDNRRGEVREERRLALSRPGAGVRRAERLRGILSVQDGWLLGWGRKSRGAGGGLLWGLDHLRHNRPFQGCPGDMGLV
ncbi:MAG: hypothetical protein AVDCRST_MAG58-3432, partial [uncultured Rubrobacteraceae bacterium]